METFGELIARICEGVRSLKPWLTRGKPWWVILELYSQKRLAVRTVVLIFHEDGLLEYLTGQSIPNLDTCEWSLSGLRVEPRHLLIQPPTSSAPANPHPETGA